jgi:hypothetical protein
MMNDHRKVLRILEKNGLPIREEEKADVDWNPSGYPVIGPGFAIANPNQHLGGIDKAAIRAKHQPWKITLKNSTVYLAIVGSAILLALAIIGSIQWIFTNQVGWWDKL